MGVALNSTDTGVQLEHVKDKVALLFAQDDTLFSAIEGKIDKDTVSSRTMRVPIRIQGGIPFAQVNPDNGDLGLGSNDLYDVAVNLTPVWFSTAVALSKLAIIATDSKKKSVEDVLTVAFQSGKKQLRTGLETLLNTDGSGTVDVVQSVPTVITGGTQIIVNNPNAFSEGSFYQVYSALGGTLRGGFNVITVDANSQNIVSNAVPSGTTTGDLLLVAGSAGTAGTSLYGLEYHDTNLSTGSWLGLSRATYPNKLKTPYVNAGGSALSPQLVRQVKQYIKRALGDDADVDKLLAHCGPEITAAWEDAQLSVTTVIQNQISGDESLDMGKKRLPQTMGGNKIVESIKAVRGRIDFLNLSTWGFAEIQPIDMFSIAGQTQFQTYGASGGVNAAQIFYYWVGLQLYTNNLRANGYIDSIYIPTGY
jgi:hypothetical protein